MNSPGDAHKKDVLEIPDTINLCLLYTNDLRGEAEQMAYLATAVKQVRAGEPYVMLVDSGNWAMGTMLSDTFKGMPMVEILGALKYDGVGVGEGEMAFGKDNLYTLSAKAAFPLISCNMIEEQSGKAPPFMKSHVIVQKGPFKVAITGISPMEKLSNSGLVARDPFAALPGVMEEINFEKPDLLIVLSRLGIERDEAIVRAFPQINVIVGGRDGLNLESPRVAGSAFLCQAGERGKFLGRLDLEMQGILRITPAK
jgi:2',3'-cyclic-nucleotide 2'-phosphodiesterase (5'-nucleotidase family)